MKARPRVPAVLAGVIVVVATIASSASAQSGEYSDLATQRAMDAHVALAELPTTGPVRVVTLTFAQSGRPLVEVGATTNPAAAEAEIEHKRKDRDVVAIEIDRRMRALDHPMSGDPLRSRQWGMTRLRAEHLWSLSTGTDTTIAVIDTGVDGAHPDLRGALVPGADYVSGAGDGLTDPDGHGTHVAGVAVAVPGNGEGVVGLAPGAKVMPMRVLDADGNGYASDVARGIVDAVDRGADVINLSLGGPMRSAAVEAAVDYALRQQVPVVAAMGNERAEGNPINYPAAQEGVIAVAATTPNGEPAPFSNTGAHVAVAAPGVGILSPYRGQYGSLSGTSMAAPHVSAAVATLLSASPALTVQDVRSVLMSTAEDLGSAGFDPATGAGLVDPVAAVASQRPVQPPVAPPGPPTAMRGLPRDWQGDGHADVLASDRSGRLLLYPGSGTGGFLRPRQIGHGWLARDLLTHTGDWNGDRRPDLIARSPSDGGLWLYSGDGTGGFLSARRIGNGWNGMDALLSASDWDGDGHVDLVSRRRSDGALYLYSGNGRGGFDGSRQIGKGWGGMSLLAVAGDWDTDRSADVVGRDSVGRLHLYAGNGRGGFSGSRVIGTGWQGVTGLHGLGDWDGDARPDLLAVMTDGTMRLYPSDGTGGFRARRTIGTGWSSYRIAS